MSKQPWFLAVEAPWAQHRRYASQPKAFERARGFVLGLVDGIAHGRVVVSDGSGSVAERWVFTPGCVEGERQVFERPACRWVKADTKIGAS